MVLIGPFMFGAALLAGVDGPAAPAFDRYPATAPRSARAAAPRLSDPLSRRYRSALREAGRGGPNFAGHYILAQVGCGAGCIRVAAIDRTSGRVAWFPATVSGWPLQVTEPLVFHRDSRLLVIHGMLDEKEPLTVRSYFFDGSRFQRLTEK